MKIKIAENVSSIYAMDKINYSHEFAVKLDAIKGQWVDVETDFLFKDQFNTAPIEGVTTMGLRIHEHMVTGIEDDARVDVCRCNYCGKTSTKEEVEEENKNLIEMTSYLKRHFCPKCHKQGYLTDLTPKKKMLWSSDNGVWSLVRRYREGRKQLVVQNFGRCKCEETFSVDIKSDGSLVYPYHVNLPQYAQKAIVKALKDYYNWSRY